MALSTWRSIPTETGCPREREYEHPEDPGGGHGLALTQQ